MKVLVVMFGGLDHRFLLQWKCPNLMQQECGPVVVDELHGGRDVASQITAQLITGRTWRENGITDRRVRRTTYRNPIVARLETGLLSSVDKGRTKRHDVYRAMRWADIVERDFVADDLTCPSLFEVIEDSCAVYVPAYNPEPTAALDRNILDPRRQPELGVEGALDLREKNFTWRRRRFFEALYSGPHQLLFGQFQYIDSTQHLYLDYVDPPRMDEVEAAYWRMDALAEEIVAAASAYDRVLFISDNGAARKDGFQPTHFNRPFYSVNARLGLESPNIRSFFATILDWVHDEPRQAAT